MKTELPLGQKSEYKTEYDALLLFPIPRKLKRDEIFVPDALPFHGVDIWNAYEVSWLNEKGKPCVAILRVTVPCDSENIIESKSFKLYLNSFNQTRLKDRETVEAIILKDLSQAVVAPVQVELMELNRFDRLELGSLVGECIDDLDVEIDLYDAAPEFLSVEESQVVETLMSDLLKSNCLVTYQPDWGSLMIHYEGSKIDREGLLKYIVSLRMHNEFHEQCVERIFMDVMKHCQPKKLTVYARYTRRGGLDINPFRSNFEEPPKDLRLARQ